LIPGCGSSELGAELYELGYLNITSIDTSEAVIEQLSARYAELADMEHAVMDATQMDCLPESCFDLVIDKALLDCLLCSNDNGKLAAKLLRQVSATISMSICCAYKLSMLVSAFTANHCLTLKGSNDTAAYTSGATALQPEHYVH
jgi:Methyltransferase domain